MYLQCIKCVKHILVMFQVCVKKYQVYQRVSCASNVSSVSEDVLGVSYVHKVYQTYTRNEGICDILQIDV